MDMCDIEQLRTNDYHVFRWIYHGIPLPSEIFEEVREGLYFLASSLMNQENASISSSQVTFSRNHPPYWDLNNWMQETHLQPPTYSFVNPSCAPYLVAPEYHQGSFIPQFQNRLTGHSYSWGFTYQDMNHFRLAEADTFSTGPLNYTQRVDLDLQVEWNNSSPNSDVFSPQSYCESVATPAPKSGWESNETSSHSLDDNFGHFYEDSGTPNKRTESGYGNIRVRKISELSRLPRKKVSDEARAILQAAFRDSNYLKSNRREVLAEETSLTPRQVQIWFQNARKQKKSFDKATK